MCHTVAQISLIMANTTFSITFCLNVKITAKNYKSCIRIPLFRYINVKFIKLVLDYALNKSKSLQNSLKMAKMSHFNRFFCAKISTFSHFILLIKKYYFGTYIYFLFVKYKWMKVRIANHKEF